MKDKLIRQPSGALCVSMKQLWALANSNQRRSMLIDAGLGDETDARKWVFDLYIQLPKGVKDKLQWQWDNQFKQRNSIMFNSIGVPQVDPARLVIEIALSIKAGATEQAAIRQQVERTNLTSNTVGSVWEQSRELLNATEQQLREHLATLD